MLGSLLCLALATSVAAAEGPAAAAVQQAAPTLRIEAPPGLEDVARRLRQLGEGGVRRTAGLVGLQSPVASIRVVLAAEDSELARAAPSWVAGYAHSREGVVVLFPGRQIPYPDDSLEDLLDHEVAHVLVARAARGGEVPRWFHEGVALMAGSGWDLEDRTRLTLAMLLGGRTSIADLEERFAAGEASARGAYALAGAFVRDLVLAHGRGVVADILRRVAGGANFDLAFRRATGRTLVAAEESFWRRRSVWNRWVPLITSSLVLWTAIALLALEAIRRRRRRSAAILARWQEEEPGDDG